VSTAALFEVLGTTLSAIAAAIFSAPTLKFIFNKNDVRVVDFTDTRRAERASTLLDLDTEETAAFASASEYIPTEYTSRQLTAIGYVSTRRFNMSHNSSAKLSRQMGNIP
jgi:hypothetical protein